MMANALRAGMTMQLAFESVAKEFGNPISQEFKLLLREVKLGKQFEIALEDLRSRVGSEDLSLLVVSINIARQLGGNITEIFDIISTTLRERFKMEGKIRAMTAQGKMQGVIVSLLPVIVGFVFSLIRPDLMDPFLEDWRGLSLLAILLMMQVCGAFLIFKITNVDV